MTVEEDRGTIVGGAAGLTVGIIGTIKHAVENPTSSVDNRALAVNFLIVFGLLGLGAIAGRFIGSRRQALIPPQS